MMRLKEAMNTGSQGMSSFLEDPADRTAPSRMMRATAQVNEPNLNTISNR
jgi:hypothetical protein